VSKPCGIYRKREIAKKPNDQKCRNKIKSIRGVAVKESEIGLLLSFEPIRAPRFAENIPPKWLALLSWVARVQFKSACSQNELQLFAK
jgi:hypothetical protein